MLYKHLKSYVFIWNTFPFFICGSTCKSLDWDPRCRLRSEKGTFLRYSYAPCLPISKHLKLLFQRNSVIYTSYKPGIFSFNVCHSLQPNIHVLIIAGISDFDQDLYKGMVFFLQYPFTHRLLVLKITSCNISWKYIKSQENKK